MTHQTIETDVLVIGGGMAGCYAAIKASDQGANVILVDKGHAGKSGQTPFAGSFLLFNSEWGDDLDAWMKQFNVVGEYVNNRVWTEIGIRESYQVYHELSSWGMKFDMTKEGKPHRASMNLGPCEATFMKHISFGDVLRRQVLKRNVKIMDRTMITSLLKQDEGVIGAIGVPVETDELVVFKAKAVVMCAGAGAFKPPAWPMHGLTSDGDAMAYRIGMEITGKEYTDPHHTTAEHPAYIGFAQGEFGPPKPPKDGDSDERPKGPPMMARYNAEGDEIPGIGTLFLNAEFEAHAGRGPITSEHNGEKVTFVGGATSGMSVHKAEGIWPGDTDCSTSMPGLYAAGDALGNMQSGSIYAAIGTSISSCAITGARAGRAAAEFAIRADFVVPDGGLVDELMHEYLVPAERKGGFGPDWVTQLLQNYMMPYYVMYVKHGDRLQATLTMIEFLRDHLVPKMVAKDPHELRLAFETRNMVLNAEMRLRSSLFRTESRGCHYREDYPQRDDPNWLAWILLKEQDGKMITIKKQIPEEWWPDLDKPIEERYPVIQHFPVFE